MLTLLSSLNVKFHYDKEDERVFIFPSTISSFEIPINLARTMRASILFLGSLIARFKKVKIPLPGGCAIGKRPIDQHLKGLKFIMLLRNLKLLI